MSLLRFLQKAKKKLGIVESKLMFHLYMNCDNFSSPLKYIYYATISLHVQEFIMVSPKSNLENMLWATPKYWNDPRHKTGKIRKWKCRILKSLMEGKIICTSESHKIQTCTAACGLASKI